MTMTMNEGLMTMMTKTDQILSEMIPMIGRWEGGRETTTVSKGRGKTLARTSSTSTSWYLNTCTLLKSLPNC